MFSENTAAFMSDFGVTCVFGTLSATVLLSSNEKDVVGGRGMSTSYQMRYWSAELPGLKYGSAVTVDGTAYRVLTTGPEGDGKISVAVLERS
jgi:hypothetical protein